MKKMLGYAMLITCLLLAGCGQSENDVQTDNGQNGQAQNDDGNAGNEENEEENVDEEQNGDGQNNNEDEENNMADKDIFKFKHIAQAPEATEEKPVDEVIKVYFAEHSIDIPLEDSGVAIDIANNEMHVHPVINHRGFRAQGGIVQLSDAEKVIDILDAHHVQEWPDEPAPDSESEDGYSWKLWLQYKDGSVQKYEGNEQTEKPEQFEAFASELREYAAARVEED
ncbi:hypothetical protein [Virgibacillus sp. YIM 98842]|uniref:hypothetical protein n=1 Tax=Virgibacillus sp. YIM 98842 TaxID=2663533 RepID=UPI0013DB1629|nr:hypothetical protein [Virgibacillus sp. YIM 98842]